MLHLNDVVHHHLLSGWIKFEEKKPSSPISSPNTLAMNTSFTLRGKSPTAKVAVLRKTFAANCWSIENIQCTFQ